MWFNNLQIYRFTQAFTLNSQELNEKLQEFRFKPCGKLQLASYGWTAPLGKYGDELNHVTNGDIMICARKDEKILPASVVRELVDEKVAEIEEMQARKVYKKEKEALKDDTIHSLLPRAFLRSNLMFAYISPRENMIVINASSSKKAEELLEYLRRSIGSLPVMPITLTNSPAAIMTRWITGEDIPVDFLINDECELHDTVEDGGIIRCKRQDLEAEEIQAHITAGKQVVKLSITWQDNLSCIVDNNFSINRLKFSDEVIEKAESPNADDYASQFDEDFAIMALELKQFIPRLIEVFGGENESAYTKITKTVSVEKEEKLIVETDPA